MRLNHQHVSGLADFRREKCSIITKSLFVKFVSSFSPVRKFYSQLVPLFNTTPNF